MAYTATYESADLDDIIIDAIAGLWAALADNAELLGLLVVIGLLVGMASGLFGKMFGMFRNIKN